jgi:hypothetical protein
MPATFSRPARSRPHPQRAITRPIFA